MQCPDCGGPMWDNSQTKRNPKQPDYKCKNKACDKAVWLKGKENGAATNGAAASGNGHAPTNGKRPLGRLYYECMKIAAGSVKQVLGDKATPADVIAATATVFIAATNTGAPLMKPKAAPAPPPPPPKPVVVPEPQEPEGDSEWNHDADDSDLPF